MRLPRGLAFYGRYHALKFLGIFCLASLVVFLYLSSELAGPGGPDPHAFWHPPRPPPSRVPPEEWNLRADAVRDAFRHAYRGYTRYAAPHDELCPVSNVSTNKYVLNSVCHDTDSPIVSVLMVGESLCLTLWTPWF